MSEPLYHGTDDVSAYDIITNGIDIYHNPRGGDFGVGFYLTPNLKSACDMALRKAFNRASPEVVELLLRNDFRSLLKIKDFGAINSFSDDVNILYWAQFIVNNRCGEQYIKKCSSLYGYEDNNLDGRYDIVIGSIADGSVSKIAPICKAEKRLITLNEAHSLLDKSYGIQYCINTSKGLTAISKQPRIKKGVLWK